MTIPYIGKPLKKLTYDNLSIPVIIVIIDIKLGTTTPVIAFPKLNDPSFAIVKTLSIVEDIVVAAVVTDNKPEAKLVIS